MPPVMKNRIHSFKTGSVTYFVAIKKLGFTFWTTLDFAWLDGDDLAMECDTDDKGIKCKFSFINYFYTLSSKFSITNSLRIKRRRKKK